MQVNITHLPKSKEQFQFLLNKQSKVSFINEILDNSINDFIHLGKLSQEKTNKFLVEREILFESMILYLNSYFDIISNILFIELKKRIVNSKLDKIDYQNELITYSKATEKIVEYWNCLEFKTIRNTSNALKHKKLLKVSYTIGSEGDGVCILPFTLQSFVLVKKLYHYDVYKYGIKMMQKIIEIIKLI